MNLKLKTKHIQLIIGVALISLSSCASYKDIPYFQDLDKSKTVTEDINNYAQHIIQPKDELLIHVASLSPGDSDFNSSVQNASANPYIPVYDYLVDPNGDVDLPFIGSMKVSGLTTDELSAKLGQSLLKYMKDPRVSVRVLNFKVAILGDVARPNIYNSFSERLTLTDALSLAGDLNITAQRNDVLLVREINGKRSFYHIDLTSKNLFESPYFYLKTNDLIVVQPGKLKASTLETSGYRNASLIVSALSVIVTSIYLITTNK
jgi:polysaccharide export outer membrane protein